MAIPEGLATSVRNGLLVPFVGAGVSAAVKTNTKQRVYPTWRELFFCAAAELERQNEVKDANLVRSALDVDDFDLVELASRVKIKLPGRLWSEFLQKKFNPPRQTINDASLDLARLIWALKSNLIITTNFDKVLSWACPDAANCEILDNENYSGFISALSNPQKPYVWHLHGHIGNPDGVILTLNSYRALYGNETISTRLGAALASLHAILMEHTLLFIGFSFADAYVRRQMEWLAGTFHNSGGPHYALFHESQIADAKSALKEFSIVCLGFTDYGDPLRDLVREISNGAGTSQSPTISPVDLHPNPVTLPIEMRWSVARDLRRSVLDLITPTYLLDNSYHFLDWNPAFDIIVARQLRLRRGHHALDFVEKLVNSKQSEAHAKMAFCEGNVPLVDMEPLLFQSEEYGLIKFWKVACQITEGGVSAWSVSLNILDAERLGDLWDAIRRKLRERVNWSAYSLVYDKILLRFARYDTLVQKVAGRLQGLGTCADLGAGTGNGTVQLRRQNPSMTIYAIEPNDQMLTQMVSKLNDEKMYPSNNLFVIKQGIENLSELQEEFFDGAMMINVLYAVDDPELCLKEVARVLKKGAPLVLTTPHEKTSIDRLFNVMRDEFRESGIYEELKDGVEQAYARHQSMLAKIHRYTIEDIQGQLEQSGFDIEDFEPREYTGAVIFAHCVKR